MIASKDRIKFTMCLKTLLRYALVLSIKLATRIFNHLTVYKYHIQDFNDKYTSKERRNYS